MVTLAGWVLLMSDVPLCPSTRCVHVRERLVYEILKIMCQVEIPGHRCRANVEQRRQSISEDGLGCQVKTKTHVVPSLLDSGLVSQKVFITSFLQKSIPPQIRQLVIYYYLYEEQVDGFVRELTFAKRLHQNIM